MFATVGWATLLGKEGAAYLKPCMQPRTALEDTQVVSSDETKEERSDRDASGSAAGTCVGTCEIMKRIPRSPLPHKDSISKERDIKRCRKSESEKKRCRKR